MPGQRPEPPGFQKPRPLPHIRHRAWVHQHERENRIITSSCAFARCFNSASPSSLPCRRGTKMSFKRRVSLKAPVCATFDGHYPLVLTAALFFDSSLPGPLSLESGLSLSSTKINNTDYKSKKQKGRTASTASKIHSSDASNNLCRKDSFMSARFGPKYSLLYRPRVASITRISASCNSYSVGTSHRSHMK